MKELISLSWQTQVVLIGGYLAYVVAYSGRRSLHKTIDSLFIMLSFGGIALIALNGLSEYIEAEKPFGKQALGVFSVFLTLVCAVLWRRKVHSWANNALSWLSGSEEDGYQTAWETVVQTQSLKYSQINVALKDGRTLESYMLGDLNDLPNGPCVLGGDGSIALYVTHITDVDGKRREAKNLVDDDGARITVVPANEIVEIDFRRRRK